MQYDIVAIGEPLYELNQQPDGRFLPGFGGDTSNVVIAAARLGAKTAYISRLGGDMFGDAIRKLWQDEGVDASAVPNDADAGTGLYFVTHNAKGHSFTYRREGSAASQLAPADVPEALIASAKFLHVSGISLAVHGPAAEHAMSLARNHGVAVSFDTNYRPRLWPADAAWAAISKAAQSAAIVKTSIEDSAALFGGSDPAEISGCFARLGAKTVIVTMGADGMRLGATTIPGYKVASVDATGAGDAFTGAFLTESSRGAEPLAAARFANAAAALSTLGYGAIKPLPRRADVERFLEQQNEQG